MRVVVYLWLMHRADRCKVSILYDDVIAGVSESTAQQQRVMSVFAIDPLDSAQPKHFLTGDYSTDGNEESDRLDEEVIVSEVFGSAEADDISDFTSGTSSEGAEIVPPPPSVISMLTIPAGEEDDGAQSGDEFDGITIISSNPSIANDIFQSAWQHVPPHQQRSQQTVQSSPFPLEIDHALSIATEESRFTNIGSEMLTEIDIVSLDTTVSTEKDQLHSSLSLSPSSVPSSDISSTMLTLAFTSGYGPPQRRVPLSVVPPSLIGTPCGKNHRYHGILFPNGSPVLSSLVDKRVGLVCGREDPNHWLESMKSDADWKKFYEHARMMLDIIKSDHEEDITMEELLVMLIHEEEEQFWRKEDQQRQRHHLVMADPWKFLGESTLVAIAAGVAAIGVQLALKNRLPVTLGRKLSSVFGH